VCSSDLFWNEADRERLNGTGQFRVPDRADHAAEERFLFRRAYRRGEEKVFLSSPSFDKDGSPSPISPFLQEVMGEFGEAADKSRGGVERFATSRSVVGTEDILPFLASRADPAETDPSGVGLAAFLASERMERPPLYPKLFRDPVRLGGSAFFQAWLQGKKEYSVTEMEDFAACPYRYLSRHVFFLREPDDPPETALPAASEGEILHQALEKSLRDGTDVRETMEELLTGALSGFPERVGHRLAAGLLLEGVRKLLHDDEAFRTKYRWTPQEFEFRFGLAEERPLEIADGLFLRGRIDRIDTAPPGFGLVVDYKRSAPQRSEVKKGVETAESLALPIYLAAVRAIFGAVPAGAFLLGVTNDRRTGFFNSDLAGEGIVPEGRSAGLLLPLEGEAFDQLLEESVRKVEELAGRIASGEFPVDPLDEKLCGRLECPYRDLCRIVLASKEGEE